MRRDIYAQRVTGIASHCDSFEIGRLVAELAILGAVSIEDQEQCLIRQVSAYGDSEAVGVGLIACQLE
jgi:hypothetical protein